MKLFLFMLIFSLFSTAYSQDFCMLAKITGAKKNSSNIELVLIKTIQELTKTNFRFISDVKPYMVDSASKFRKLLAQANSILNAPQLSDHAKELRNLLYQAKNEVAADALHLKKDNLALFFKALAIAEYLTGRKVLAKSYLLASLRYNKNQKAENYLYSAAISFFFTKVMNTKKREKNISIKIKINPKQTFVKIDNQPLKPTSSTIELLPGTHVLIFLKSGYLRYTFIIDSKDYINSKLTIDMKKLSWYSKFIKYKKQIFKNTKTSAVAAHRLFKKSGCRELFSFNVNVRNKNIAIKAGNFSQTGFGFYKTVIQKDEMFLKNLKKFITSMLH